MTQEKKKYRWLSGLCILVGASCSLLISYSLYNLTEKLENLSVQNLTNEVSVLNNQLVNLNSINDNLANINLWVYGNWSNGILDQWNDTNHILLEFLYRTGVLENNLRNSFHPIRNQWNDTNQILLDFLYRTNRLEKNFMNPIDSEISNTFEQSIESEIDQINPTMTTSSSEEKSSLIAEQPEPTRTSTPSRPNINLPPVI